MYMYAMTATVAWWNGEKRYNHSEPESGGSTDNTIVDDTSNEVVKYELTDLEMKQTLGVGAFGRVKLVTAKGKDGKTKAYALKCLAKTGIVENGLQDHVLNEREILCRLGRLGLLPDPRPQDCLPRSPAREPC